MNKKFLLIAMSALFLLTCATSCNNGKSANDKNGTEEINENEGKDDALVENAEDDAIIRDFITNMYENKLYYDEDFLKAHCTAKMLQYLKDQYEYDGDGYAGYRFRTSAQDDKPGAEDIKDKVLNITKDSEGWYHYTFTDGGWHGENKIKVRVENGEVMVDELERVYDEPLEEYNRKEEISETDSSMIDPFYFSGKRDHQFRIANTQTIPDVGNNQYAVSWYVDTVEWDFDPQTNHIYSKIEFKKGDAVLASFYDDDGWSYIGVENSKAKMFKSFRIDSDHTAVVFRGGIYADGVSNLTVFVLSGNEVKVVFNKLYDFDKIGNGKVFFKYDGGKSGCLNFIGGHISIFSNDYPTGKIIF
jgi:hypothetical protein